MKSPEKKSPVVIENSLAVLAKAQLEFADVLLQQVSRFYLARLRREIAHLIEIVEKQRGIKNLSPRKKRDLQKLIELVRRLQVKPERGRRKDLKKIDALIGEAQHLLETW